MSASSLDSCRPCATGGPTCGRRSSSYGRTIAVSSTSWISVSTIPQHTWVSKLFGYSFQVEYKPGKQNAAADALSWRDEHELGARVHTQALSRPEFPLLDAFRREAQTLPEIVAKRHEIHDGFADTVWSEADGFVLHQGRIYIPA